MRPPTNSISIDKETWGRLVGNIRDTVQQAGGKIGDVTVSLAWKNRNDLDLHVVTGSGEEIYFAHKESACGGKLDVDMNVTGNSEHPVENVRWLGGARPKGPLKIYVVHYRNHGLDGCDDPTEFLVSVKVGATNRLFTGTVSNQDGEANKVLVAEIPIP